MSDIINKYLNDFWSMVDIEFVVKFVVVYFFIVWISIIVRVMRDIVTRTNNVFYQIFCVFLILILSPFGVFIYLLVRPSKTLHEKYYEEIEKNIDIIEELINEKGLKDSDSELNISEDKKNNKIKINNTEKKVVKKTKKSSIKVKKF